MNADDAADLAAGAQRTRDEWLKTMRADLAGRNRVEDAG